MNNKKSQIIRKGILPGAIIFGIVWGIYHGGIMPGIYGFLSFIILWLIFLRYFWRENQ